jgi:lipopolysaccharide export system permease protein
MKLLDKYIIKKYLSTFFFTALICSMIIVVIDVSQRVENFINEKLGFYDIIFVYYLNFIPHINIILFPLYALISVIFFTSKLAYDSEIISILNAGVSFRRLMRPYMISAGLICLLLLFFNHIADPWSSKKRVAFENTYFYKGNKDFDRASNIHFFLDSTSKVYVRYFREGENSISDFRLERFSDNQLVYMLKATRADWIEETEKWKISDYKVFTFEGKRETFKSGLGMNFDTTLNMRPSDFIRFKNQKEMMTTAEIRTYIRSERDRGISNTKVFETEIHRRTADAFTLIILTLIGLTVASRKVRGGMGLHLAIGIGLGAAHIVLSKFAITFAQGNIIPPVIGVWIPNILFSLVALNLLRKAQK